MTNHRWGAHMVGYKWFGKRAVDVSDTRAWTQHDATKTWSDGGAVRDRVTAATTALISDLERIVAENASASVVEYASAAEAGIRADGGEVLIGIRLYNDEASMIVEVPLRRLIVDALTEMRPRLGVDPQAQGALSALVALGQSLASLTRANDQPPSVPAGIGHNSQHALSAPPAGRRIA